MALIKKVVVLFFISSLFFSCTKKSGVSLAFPDASYIDTENVLHEGKSGSYRYFYFNSELKEKIYDFYRRNQNAALLIQVAVKKVKKNTAEYQDQYGFLYKNDFNSFNSISLPLSQRPLVSVNFNDFSRQKIALLYSFSKDYGVPDGFFIKSLSTVKILSCELTPAACGFDYSKEIPLYAFAPNGGVVIKDEKKLDFSGLSLCFSAHNTKDSLMPVLKIFYNSNKKTINFTAGGEKITVRTSDNSFTQIPFSSLKSPYSAFEITENSECVSSVLALSSDISLLDNSAEYINSPVRPIKTDPGLIMKWPKENWRGRDYELFEWDRFNKILFFDTADYEVQNDFFRRLAFFVEKKGFKGRLLSDEELEGKHGYNGHDYKACDLARFFEKARVLNFPLNKKELLLREILEVNSIIVRAQDNSWVEGEGAVISISQDSSMDLRTAFVAHEGWHGIYFIDSEFRDTVSGIFYMLKSKDPLTLNFLIRYFQVTPTLNYDTDDDYLLKNEFMAYMLQRPVSVCESYYVNMASRNHAQSLIKSESDYIISTKASGFVGSAQMLEDYVSGRWNLAAGRVWLVSR